MPRNYRLLANPKNLERAFLEKVSPCPNTGCWWWLGEHTKPGRAVWRLTHEGRTRWYIAARLSLQIKLGRKLRRNALHTCDQPGCVNPNHLYEGAPKDNNRDMVARNRQRKPWRRTHCKRGHAFTSENTKWIGEKQRCRTCLLTATARWIARTLEAGKKRKPVKEHCAHGHAMKGKNLYWVNGVEPRCVACNRKRARDWRRSKLEIPPERWRIT